MIKVGIVGGTGYTGAELMRLLVAHPDAEVVSVTSRSDQGRPVVDIYPHLRGSVDLAFVAPDLDNLKDCEPIEIIINNNLILPNLRIKKNLE